MLFVNEKKGENMTTQLFKYAGYSVTENGQTKARFGNDMVSRIKKLTAKGNQDTWFAELPQAMTKKEFAVLIQNFSGNQSSIGTIQTLRKRTGFP